MICFCFAFDWHACWLEIITTDHNEYSTKKVNKSNMNKKRWSTLHSAVNWGFLSSMGQYSHREWTGHTTPMNCESDDHRLSQRSLLIYVVFEKIKRKRIINTAIWNLFHSDASNGIVFCGFVLNRNVFVIVFLRFALSMYRCSCAICVWFVSLLIIR